MGNLNNLTYSKLYLFNVYFDAFTLIQIHETNHQTRIQNLLDFYSLLFILLNIRKL